MWINPDEIIKKLDMKGIEVRLAYFDEVDSTNNVAKSFIQDGVTDGLVVISATQTAGRGRFLRSWVSPPGGLYTSLVVKPILSPADMPPLGILAGCSTAAAVRSTCSLDVHLKWPNDILVDEKKVGGILSESIIEEDQVVSVILGIGINVNLELDDYPEDLRNGMTTILHETGQETSIEELAASLLGETYSRISEVEARQTFLPVLSEYKKVCNTLGRRVIVEQTDATLEGTALDVDESGALVLETGEGIEIVSAGDVQHLHS
ncbi:MAG: biotin--[acetyl-CoA-carboxylase] ligase [Candidatus Thorarchaeota archaeon]